MYIVRTFEWWLLEQAERRSSKIHCTNSKNSQHSAYPSLRKYFTAGEDGACIKLDCLYSRNMQISSQLVLHDRGKQRKWAVSICSKSRKTYNNPNALQPHQMNNRTDLQKFNSCHGLNGLKGYLSFSIKHNTYFFWKKVPWWSTGSKSDFPSLWRLARDRLFFRQTSGGLPVHSHIMSTLCRYKAGWKSATFPFEFVQQ